MSTILSIKKSLLPYLSCDEKKKKVFRQSLEAIIFTFARTRLKNNASE